MHERKQDGNIKNRAMVRAMCGAQVRNRKLANGLMLILGLNETKDQLAVIDV